MFWIENSAGDIIKMTPARIHLPNLHLAHPPNLDRPIILRGNNSG